MKTHVFQAIGIIVLLTLLTPFTLQAKTTQAENIQTVESTRNIIINEVMFSPDVGGYEWVELKNNGSTSEDIDGYALTDEDGNWYQIPNTLPEVPSGAFVVIIFNGLGSASDDYDFSDNMAALHSQTGLVNIFEDDGDQVVLYNGIISKKFYLPLVTRNVTGISLSTSSFVGNSIKQGNIILSSASILAFFAWGADPSTDATNAIDAGLWTPNSYLVTKQSPGYSGMIPNGSIGLISTQSNDADWQIYLPTETSQGTNNMIPGPNVISPPDGIITCDHQVTFNWSSEGAEEYYIQIDDQSDFSSPIIATNIISTSYRLPSEYPDGIFFFRVKAIGAGNHYSQPSSVEFINCPQPTLSTLILPVQLNVPFLLQHKDTRMLNIDGAINVSGNTELGRASRWDSSHEDDVDWVVGNGAPRHDTHMDNSYCTRASIAMIAAYYQGELSQDRISFYAYGEGPPENDLGAGNGLWPNELATEGKGKNVFNWALDDAPVLSSKGKPTYEQIKGWIDAGRPILIVIYTNSEKTHTHTIVIDGYWDILGHHLAYMKDPSIRPSPVFEWESLDVVEYHVPPSGYSGRSDEDIDSDGIRDTIDDSDNDGVVDFDERNRFNLNPNNPDTDGDGVPDKADVREYVFNNDGIYDYRSPYWGTDNRRKELDPDHDNDGSLDGCEDTNHNGKYESALGETDNFDSTSHKTCVPPGDILFSDDFNDGNADGWTTSGSGTFYVENNEYVIDTSGGYFQFGYSSNGSLDWTDYTLSVDLFGELGVDKIVAVRYIDDAYFYDVNLRSSPWNDVILQKLSNDGEGTWLANVHYDNINNTWYNIKIDVHGEVINVYIDDTLVITYTDTGTSMTNGKIALMSYTSTYGLSKIRFDNVIVTSIP